MTAAYHEILLATADQLASAPKPQKALIARLREAAATLEKVPEAKREKVAMALRVMEPKLVVLPAYVDRADFRAPSEVFPSLSDAYPNAPVEMQARLVLGEKPASVTGLSAKEAHEYLSSPPPEGSRANPASWLLARAELKYPDEESRTRTGVNIKTLRLRIDSVPLARWLIDRWKDPAQIDALVKERVERGPHGEEVRGRFIDRVDELKDADLRPSVRDTFMAAGQRMAKELEAELKKAHKQEPLAPTPHWWRSVRCATLLDRPKLIAAEGAEMKHCVANYVPYVRQQRSVLVSIRVRDKVGFLHRSTVELNRQTLEVFQHRGIGNREPHELNKRALVVMLRRWREAKDKRERPTSDISAAEKLRALGEREGNPAEHVVWFAETPNGSLHMLPDAGKAASGTRRSKSAKKPARTSRKKNPTPGIRYEKAPYGVTVDLGQDEAAWFAKSGPFRSSVIEEAQKRLGFWPAQIQVFSGGREIETVRIDSMRAPTDREVRAAMRQRADNPTHGRKARRG